MARSVRSRFVLAGALALALAPAPAPAQARDAHRCREWDPATLRRNPTETQLRCRFGALGPGRFGLLSYVDVPVYQPRTPMPGTHLIGVPGHATPRPGESYEEWEWRVLRTEFGPEVRRPQRGLELLDPFAASRIIAFEQRLAEAGVRAVRRETWRSPERQAYLFQQGRSRPGPLATATLTSWHSHVDSRGHPAGRAVDYDVPSSHLPRFHQIARSVGLTSYGADSFDPGHVFLPETEQLPSQEIILLRVLPRVPEVTLSTGLPVDRPLPAGGRQALRAAAREFASMPFIGHHPASLARPRPLNEPLLTPQSPGGPACRVTAGQRPRTRSDADGARCGSRRNGARVARESARNTGG